MPLHLLGKKSWNVYSAANIERVKRDEAAAAAEEAAAEQRMQEEDAEQRMRALRGLSPLQLPTTASVEDTGSVGGQDKEHRGHDRKRRRLRGEDDTDRDIRHAREDQALEHKDSRSTVLHATSSDAPLVDRDGHIALFVPDPKSTKGAESDKLKAAKGSDRQWTSRPSKDDSFHAAVGQAPWYSAGGAIVHAPKASVGQDAWGNEDPRRKDRDMARLTSSDPLAMMQRGAQAVRSMEKEKRRWRDERNREISDMVMEERRKERKRRHAEHRTRHMRCEEEVEYHRKRRPRDTSPEAESLEGFRLDETRSERSGSRRHERRHSRIRAEHREELRRKRHTEDVGKG